MQKRYTTSYYVLVKFIVLIFLIKELSPKVLIAEQHNE